MTEELGTIPKGRERSNVSPQGHVQLGCVANQASYPAGIGDKAMLIQCGD